MRNFQPGTPIDRHHRNPAHGENEAKSGKVLAMDGDASGAIHETLASSSAFPVVASAESFFLLDRLRVVIRELLLGIRARRGFLLLTGEVGLGKTTISRHVMRILEEEGTAFALVFNTLLDGNDLLQAINHDFGIREPTTNIQRSLVLLNSFLIEQYESGRNCVIVVDDAQNLPDSALELIRMLSNLETNSEKLLQILLVGQPELQARLDRPELRQLRSRVAVNTILEPLSRDETRRYLEFRLLTDPDRAETRVTEAARYAVHRLTAGIPRRINILMDRCLRLADQRSTPLIDDVIVNDAAAALGMVFPGRLTRWLRFLGGPRPGRAIAAVFGVTAIAVLALGITVFDRSSYIANPLNKEPAPVSAVVDTEVGQLGAEATEALEETHHLQMDPNQELLASFLEGHGIPGEAERVQEAIQSNTLEALDSIFARDYGLRIVVLDGVEQSFWPRSQSIHVNPEDAAPHFMVIWRPDWWVGEFRSGSRSDAIRQLQEQLILSGHYPGTRADGIVGPMTTQGLRDFQRAAGIEVTGRPNALTQFLLQNQN